MSDWLGKNDRQFHDVALSGRPFLAFGRPRYGHNVQRQAIVHFETGKGCRENGEPFEVEQWQKLPANPSAQPTGDGQE